MERESSTDRFAVRLFACLLILSGVDAVVDMLYGVFHGSLDLDLGFLTIFVGKGLLERREIWRKWAVALAWVGIVGAPIAGVVLVVIGPGDSIRLHGVDIGTRLPSVLAYALLASCLALGLWQRRVLSKEAVKAAFAASGRPGPESSWWTAIAAVAVVASCGGLASRHVLQTVLDTVEHHAVTIHAVDADTGEPLTPWFAGPARVPGQKLPKAAYGTGSSEDGTRSMELSWIACRPITIRVSAEGHVAKDVVLPPEDGRSVVRVELEREESSSGVGGGGAR